MIRSALRSGPALPLMESLSPMDWTELATKSDLTALEEQITARFEVSMPDSTHSWSSWAPGSTWASSKCAANSSRCAAS